MSEHFIKTRSELLLVAHFYLNQVNCFDLENVVVFLFSQHFKDFYKKCIRMRIWWCVLYFENKNCSSFINSFLQIIFQFCWKYKCKDLVLFQSSKIWVMDLKNSFWQLKTVGRGIHNQHTTFTPKNCVWHWAIDLKQLKT